MRGTLLASSLCLLITVGMATSPEYVTAEQETACVICHEDCPVGEHVAANGGYSLPLNWRRNGGAHNGFACLAGSCATKHGPEGCSGGMLQRGDVESLERAVLAGSVSEVEGLIQRFPENIALNTERGAVQVRDCTGGLIAHFPVDPDIASSLGE